MTESEMKRARDYWRSVAVAAIYEAREAEQAVSCRDGRIEDLREMNSALRALVEDLQRRLKTVQMDASHLIN